MNKVGVSVKQAGEQNKMEKKAEITLSLPFRQWAMWLQGELIPTQCFCFLVSAFLFCSRRSVSFPPVSSQHQTEAQ